MSTQFVSKHSIYYTNRALVPIPDIADSLLGVQRVVKQMYPVFAKLIPDCGLSNAIIDLESLQSGSLRDNFMVRFIFGDEEGMNRWIRLLREKTGVAELNQRLPIVGPLITGALLVGATVAVTRMAGKDSSIPGTNTHIEVVNSTVIATGARHLGLTDAQFSDLLQKGSGNQFNLASNACRVIRPAKASQDASIVVDESPDLTITPEAVRETPSRVERAADEPQSRRLTNETIRVRALDLDSQKKGWAVVVPSVSDRRIRMEVAPEVDRSRLVRSGPQQADIEVFFRVSDDGEEVPLRAVVLALH